MSGERAKNITFRHTLAGLARGPLQALEAVGRQNEGAIVRLHLGPFRPYLVTRPEHVQRVLRDQAANYRRDGMMWRPLRRLLGDGILSEGGSWQQSRRLMQPLFSARRVATFVDQMAKAIVEAVDALDSRIRSGQPIDAAVEMTRIVYRTVIRVLFGDRISDQQAAQLVPALETAATSITSRLLFPFVPQSVPMPGDRAFRRAVTAVDEVMFPLVRQSRRQPAGDGDLVSMLCQATGEDGRGLDDRQVRDDVVSIFAAGTETTAVALTWLWVVLDAHPDVAAELYQEVDDVVGGGPVHGAHLAELRYTRMVLQELLRLYPTGWMIPRKAAEEDVIDGTAIEAGGTVLISPYVTHRLDGLWERPDVFDPERFAPNRAERRHRFSYFPFGGGPHQCLGSHFFTMEAQLVIAALLSRYRPRLCGSRAVVPKAAASLRPADRVRVSLRPIGRNRRCS
ncbi:MAG TPA: cytochrome P450 [Kribbellaceae bacterium]|nr:cytochrome P450 [Kribbellaceae bacterium]